MTNLPDSSNMGCDKVFLGQFKSVEVYVCVCMNCSGIFREAPAYIRYYIRIHMYVWMDVMSNKVEMHVLIALLK